MKRSRPRIVLVCPQERDLAAVRSAGLDSAYEIVAAGTDLDGAASFDPQAFLDEWEGVPFDGVVGTKDRSALLASLLAERLGLPGPSPQAILACQHKPTSRAIQRGVVPEATPAFAPIGGRGPAPLPTPFFVKPVVGRLSQYTAIVNSAADLGRIPRTTSYTEAYADIAELAGLERSACEGLLGETLLTGAEVTVEGYVHRGCVTVLGITDSVRYPGTASFERFEYPTALPQARQDELRAVAERVLPALGFDGGCFNLELFVPRTGEAKIVEVNARIASQFAPLLLATHGRSNYDVLFEVARGAEPRWPATDPEGVAISYCLRTFRDAFVAAVPDPEPGLEILVRPGLRLSEQGTNDLRSYRLAIFTEVGETRAEALFRCRARTRLLRFELAGASRTSGARATG